MRRRTQARLIKNHSHVQQASESIESWRVKIETPQRRTSNPPEQRRSGLAGGWGGVNNGRLLQRLITLLMEKPRESLVDAG